jgi:hypothetical protein
VLIEALAVWTLSTVRRHSSSEFRDPRSLKRVSSGGSAIRYARECRHSEPDFDCSQRSKSRVGNGEHHGCLIGRVFSFRPHQIEVRTELPVVWQHERPTFAMVVGVRNVEGEPIQICRALAPGDIDEVGVNSVWVHGFASNQARANDPKKIFDKICNRYYI